MSTSDNAASPTRHVTEWTVNGPSAFGQTWSFDETGQILQIGAVRTLLGTATHLPSSTRVRVTVEVLADVG